jgi:hypothetical protein
MRIGFTFRLWFRLRHTVEKINASPLSEAKTALIA